MLFMFENFIMFSIMNITLSKPKHESCDDYFDLLSRTNKCLHRNERPRSSVYSYKERYLQLIS